MSAIKQLQDAKIGAEKVIKDLEAASIADRADRSVTIALLKRDIASYDAQISKLTPVSAPTSEPAPAPAETKSPK